MKRAGLVLVLFCGVGSPVLANDWATTGKGGSGGEVVTMPDSHIPSVAELEV